MQLIEVTDKKTHKIWLRVSQLIHQNDPLWIPPLRQDVEKVFDPKKNKAFNHGEAIRWILVNDQDQPIGRIATFTNKKYANPLDYPVGGIGFFECIDDQEAANMLFDASKKWLEERGMEGMDGPINFGEKNMFWGLLIENFEAPNTYGLDLHPSYYRKLFENYGFKIFYKQLIFHRTLKKPAQEDYYKKAELLEKRYNVHASNVKGYSLDRIVQDFMTVYNSAWGSHDGFKPMSKMQAKKIIKSMKPVMDPKVAIFAYHQEEPIGFFINLPELNQIFKHVNGNLNWWGKLKFLYHKWARTPTTMYGLVFGVAKEWQGKGVEGIMIKYGSDTIVRDNLYDDMIMTWIGDFNPKMIAIGKKLEGELYRTYATMRHNFDPNREFERHPLVNYSNNKKSETA